MNVHKIALSNETEFYHYSAFHVRNKNLNKFGSGNLHQIFTFFIVNMAVAGLLMVGDKLWQYKFINQNY